MGTNVIKDKLSPINAILNEVCQEMMVAKNQFREENKQLGEK